MRKIKEIATMFTVTALTIGMIPIQTVQTSAATATGSYQVIVEPTMNYDQVIGFSGGLSLVEKDYTYGVIDTTGKEILSCTYERINFIDEKQLIYAKDANSAWYIFDWTGRLLNTIGEYYDMEWYSDTIYFYNESYEVVKKVNLDGTDKTDEELPFDTSAYYGCDKLMKVDKYLAYNWDEETNEFSFVLLDAEGNQIAALDSNYYWFDYSYYGILYGMGLSDETGVDCVLDLDGNVIASTTDGTYAKVGFYWYSDYIFVEDATGNVSMLDVEGTPINEIGKVGFDTIKGWNYESIIAADASGNWYLFDATGNELATLGRYTELTYINSEQLLGKNESGVYVVVNSDGTVNATLGKYDEIEIISDDLIGACIYGPTYFENDQDIQIFLMKTDGTGITGETEVWSVTYLTDGVVVRDMKLQNGLYDNEGKYITPLDDKITNVGDYKEGYLPVCIDGKWGIYLIIPENLKTDDQQNNNQNNNPNNNQQNTSTNNQPQVVTKNNKKVIAPGKAKIKKIKKGKKKAVVTLKKVKGAKGYMIQYSTKKNFKGAKKVYTKKLKTTVKKLKSGKKYYFRVKAYKLDGKKKVLSKKWSKVVKVKVK